MSIRFAFLLLEEHPWGREMLRVLMARGYEPELVIQEVSELAGVDARSSWRAWLGSASPRA